MKRRLYLAFALFLLLGSPSFGDSPSCDDPPAGSGACLPWGFTDLSSQSLLPIVDLSRDGSVVAGSEPNYPYPGPWSTTVDRWKLGAGVSSLSSLGYFYTKLNTYSRVLSANGDFVVVEFDPEEIYNKEPRVVRWNADSGGLVYPPIVPTSGIQEWFPLAGSDTGELVPSHTTDSVRDGTAISPDGKEIAGLGAYHALGGGGGVAWAAFRWVEGSGTSNDAQSGWGLRVFQPWAIAETGAIVGSLKDHMFAGVDQEAAIWHPSGGGTVLGPNAHSRATAVSADGITLIAGQLSDDTGPNENGRWDVGTPGVIWRNGGSHEVISSDLWPVSVSDDGYIVAGLRAASDEPWIWRDGEGDEALRDYLEDDFGVTVPATSAGNSPAIRPAAVVSGNGHVFIAKGEQWVVNVAPLNAVGLGDSYSSGEGAPAYIDGTDTIWGNQCHRSLNAYAALVEPRSSAHSIRKMHVDGVRDVSWDFFACSGAMTRNVLSTADNGVGMEGEPPQLDRPELNDGTDLVTITIGGNDAQFNRVLTFCVIETDCVDLPAPFPDAAGRTTRQYMTELIAGTVATRVQAAYTAVKDAAPKATVIALGYPRLVSGALGACPDSQVFIGPVEVGDGLTASERAWMRSSANQLEGQMAQAASQAGVHYVPIADDFEGHNVCDAAPWINGIVGLGKTESFHPNEQGQRVYADAVNRFLESTIKLDYPHGFFESGMPKNPPVP